MQFRIHVYVDLHSLKIVLYQLRLIERPLNVEVIYGIHYSDYEYQAIQKGYALWPQKKSKSSQKKKSIQEYL